MPEFTEYKEHRIFCGRCRHWGNINELDEPEFNRNGLKGYWCGDCSAKFGVCTLCGRFSPSANHCSYCFPEGVDREEIVPKPLPEALDKADFVRYSEGAGRFLHVPTGVVYALPADFLDGCSRKDTNTKCDPDPLTTQGVPQQPRLEKKPPRQGKTKV